MSVASVPAAAAESERSVRNGRGWRFAGLRRLILAPLLFVAVLLALEIGVPLSGVSAMTMVPPSDVFAVLARHYPILLQQAIPTTVETVMGFSLAALLGLVLGSAIASSERVRQAIYPNMVFFQVIPKIALAPLFIVWLGVGTPSRLAFCIFIAFFPIAVSAATGLANTDKGAIRLCRSLTATPGQIFFRVRFPYAVPYIFAGLKVGVTMSVIGIVVGEFVTAQAGLGYIVMFASSAAETALALAAILLLCCIGVGLFLFVSLAEFLIVRRLGAPIPTGEFA